MSVDMYRKQKDQIQSTISRLMEQKARETQRSVDASSRSLSGVFQGSWNMTYATSNGLRSSMTSVDFSGLSQTLPTGCQLRVFPDQRAGLSRLACW